MQQARILPLGALGDGMAGLCDGNEAAVEQAPGLDKSKQTQELAGLTTAVRANGKPALPMVEDLSRKYPEDTLIQDVYPPVHDGGNAAGRRAGIFLISRGAIRPGAAYAMAGDKANAKKAYEALLVAWKDAEADLPMFVAAKKEYAAP